MTKCNMRFQFTENKSGLRDDPPRKEGKTQTTGGRFGCPHLFIIEVRGSTGSETELRGPPLYSLPSSPPRVATSPNKPNYLEKTGDGPPGSSEGILFRRVRTKGRRGRRWYGFTPKTQPFRSAAPGPFFNPLLRILAPFARIGHYGDFGMAAHLGIVCEVWREFAGSHDVVQIQ